MPNWEKRLKAAAEAFVADHDAQAVRAAELEAQKTEDQARRRAAVFLGAAEGNEAIVSDDPLQFFRGKTHAEGLKAYEAAMRKK